MDAIDHFAVEAVRFEAWAHSSEPDCRTAVRTALLRIASLYLAGLQLPQPNAGELNTFNPVEPLPQEQNSGIVAYKTIPIDMYGEIFNPLVVPPESPVIGSIVDDLIGIYRDVVMGLRAYQTGNRTGAIWEWKFGLQHHWGEHATGAMRALHAWLSAHEIDM